MAEEKKSYLYKLKPLIDRWPAIKKPEGHVTFRTKMFWTILCLIIYFILTNVMIFGLKSDVIDLFAQYRFIMAGASGSVMHLGIGPIVTASIILQLFVGAKIINLDLSKSEDKAIYQGTQKILVLVMIVVEAVPQLFGYLQPSQVAEYEAEFQRAFPGKKVFFFLGSDWNHHSYQSAFLDEDTLYVFLRKAAYAQEAPPFPPEDLQENIRALKLISLATYKTLQGKSLYLELESAHAQ